MFEFEDEPIVFLSFANKNKAPVAGSLDKESDLIKGIIAPVEERMACRIIQEDPLKQTFLYDMAQDASFCKSVAFIHFSGGTSGRQHIYLDSKSGEIPLDADEFATFLARFPNLQVVFITGSANPRIVRKLLVQTKAVIIRLEDDTRNKEIIVNFYTQFAQGSIIKRAFGQTLLQGGDHLMYEMVTLGEIMAPPFQRKDIFEGLYVRSDNKNALEWRLSPSFFIQLDSPSKGVSQKEFAKISQNIGRNWFKPVLTGITSLVGVSMLLLGLFSQIPERLLGQIRLNTICPFPEGAGNYNILILPFYEEPGCAGSDEKYSNAIREELELLKVSNQLTINVQPHDGKCPSSDLFTQGVGAGCNANLVVWGTYSPTDVSGRTNIVIHYSTTDRYGESNFIQNNFSSYKLSNQTFDSSQDTIVGLIQDIANWGLAMDDFMKKRYDKALIGFQRISYAPEVALIKARRYQALCYEGLKQYKNALLVYDTLIAASPDQMELYVSRGRLNAIIGNLDEAKSDLDYAISQSPGDIVALLERGTLYERSKAFDKALTDYHTAVSLAPEDPEAVYRRGKLYTQLNRFDAALEDFKRSILLDPNNGERYKGRAMLHERMLQFGPALADYSSALQYNPTDAEAYNNRAKIHIRYFRMEQALLDAIEAVKIAPNEPAYFITRSKAYLGIGDSKDAIRFALADADTAVSLKGDICDAYTARAMVYTQIRLKGAIDSAANDFDKALKDNPNCTEAILGRGLLYLKFDNIDKALQQFNTVIRLQPNNVYAICERGKIYEQKNDLNRALSDYSQALKLDPNFALGYTLRANLYTLMKRFDEGLLDYDQAIAQNNGLPDPYFHRAYIFTQKGRYEDAINDVQQAIKLGKEKAEYIGLLARIYAGKREDTLFYKNFELALKKGFAPIEFQYDPAYESYRKQPKFREIISPYLLEEL